MKSTFVLALSVALAVCLGTAGATAQELTPVSVTASTTFSTYNVDNLINGSGLSGGLHDENYLNMWMSDGEVTPTLVFDLGANMALSGAEIWQYNAACCGFDRGVHGLDISVSGNGVTFTPAVSTTLTESAGGNIPAQVVSFSATGRYVKFSVTSNFGADGGYTGLSEVRFTGQQAPAAEAIPLLSTWGLLALAGALLAVALLALRW